MRHSPWTGYTHIFKCLLISLFPVGGCLQIARQQTAIYELKSRLLNFLEKHNDVYGGGEGNDLLYFSKEKKESWDQGDRICVTWAGGHTEIHGAALPLPLLFFGICLRSFIIKKLKIEMQTWSLFSAHSPMGKQTRSPGRAV